MTFHQKIFAVIVSISLLIVILEMVRRRRLKEEYSWLWLLVGVVMLVLVLWPSLLNILSFLIGAEDPLTTVFLFGFIFLVLINLDFSMQISKHKEQIKKLAQQAAISSRELKDLKNKNENFIS